MHKIPWRGIALGSLITVLLVAARAAVTIGKAYYYRYGVGWQAEVLEDPWFYVGMAAAAIGAGSLVAFLVSQKQKKPDEE